ncbi:MAG: TraM recognition domain-containing protein [Planctomycetota bacterium]
MGWFARTLKGNDPKDEISWDDRLAVAGFSPKDPWTLGDAYEGTVVFGATGAGKTSGPGAYIANGLLRLGLGGLILTVKPDEADAWEDRAQALGRGDDVRRVRPGGKYCFNFMAYASVRPHAQVGLADNIADLIATLGGITGDSATDASTKDPYWDNALKQLVRNLVTALFIANGRVTLDEVMSLVAELPQYPEQVGDPEWRERSAAGRLFQRLHTMDLTPTQRRDADVSAQYLLGEFPALDERTSSSIVSTLTTLVDPFRRGPAHELFCTGCTVFPELCRLGAIIILDLDLKTYQAFGRTAQVIFKWFFQQDMERTKSADDASPVFLYADEAQEFLTRDDKRFQATARSARVATVYLTQNIPALQARLGGEAEVHGLLGNMQTKIFCQNADPTTNKYAEQLFGERDRMSRSINMSTNQGAPAGPDQRAQQGGNQGFGLSEAREPLVRAEALTLLAKGGRSNKFRVGTWVFQGGRVWRSTGLPAMHVGFDQRGTARRSSKKRDSSKK